MSTALAPLWSIDEDLLALLDSAETCPEELRPELEAKIALYFAAEVEKVDRVNSVYQALTMQVAAANLELKRLEDRKRAAQSAIDRLDGYILRVLENRGDEPLKGKNVTFSVRPSEALVIHDTGLVPAQYRVIKTTEEIPKDPIKKAIKAGEWVPGATIEYRRNLKRS